MLYLISSFLHTRSLFIPYAYVSVGPIDCILLSSFELKAILLISSVKTLCFLLLNLCCVFKFYFFLNVFFNFQLFFLRHNFLCLLFFIFIVVFDIAICFCSQFSINFNLNFSNPVTFFFFLLGNGLSNSKFKLSSLVSRSSAMSL